MREVDDGNYGHAKPFDKDDDEESESSMPLDVEHGFASLAVGEDLTFSTDFRCTGEGAQLERGRRYSLCSRGSWVRWWRWGTMEVWAYLLSMHLLAFGCWTDTRVICID